MWDDVVGGDETQRARAEAELASALRALEQAVPGSVVAGWIERRVSQARLAIVRLDDTPAPSPLSHPASPSGGDGRIRQRPQQVEVEDHEDELGAPAAKCRPLSLSSDVLSPVTEAWPSRPHSFLATPDRGSRSGDSWGDVKGAFHEVEVCEQLAAPSDSQDDTCDTFERGSRKKRPADSAPSADRQTRPRCAVE